MPTIQGERNGLRGLMAAVIIMGILIVVGVAVLVITIVGRMSGVATQTPQFLSEPPGTRIVTIASVGDRLAVLLTGSGPDRIVLVDPRTGQVAGRIGLAQ